MVVAADQSARIDELLAKHVKDNTPGAAVLVVKDGKKIFEKGYGLANVDKAIPIRPHTVFELASCSKQFTAMAIMILAERKKLNYDDRLGKFFPEFHAAGQAITIEQLLHHTSGLPDYMDAWNASNTNAPPASRLMLELVAKRPKLLFKPGEKYDYSNTGYMVLAQIVEKASGKRFPEFIKENIFTPLGMNDSIVFDETHPKILRRALCYAREGGGFKNTSRDELGAVYGDGSVHSSIDDLFKWDQALYTEKLVSAAALKRAWTEGKTSDGKGTGYGYGWDLGRFMRTREISHGGLWLDFGTEILRLPDKQLSVIVLSNLSKFDSDTIAHKIAALYLKDE
jgi:CubicO group peptidase (beta-lactamase class C family)